MTALPPDSVLRLAKALGREEFVSACGWRLTREVKDVLIPIKQFESREDLLRFLDKWYVPRFPTGTPIIWTDRDYILIPRTFPEEGNEPYVWWWESSRG